MIASAPSIAAPNMPSLKRLLYRNRNSATCGGMYFLLALGNVPTTPRFPLSLQERQCELREIFKQCDLQDLRGAEFQRLLRLAHAEGLIDGFLRDIGPLDRPVSLAHSSPQAKQAESESRSIGRPERHPRYRQHFTLADAITLSSSAKRHSSGIRVPRIEQEVCGAHESRIGALSWADLSGDRLSLTTNVRSRRKAKSAEFSRLSRVFTASRYSGSHTPAFSPAL